MTEPVLLPIFIVDVCVKVPFPLFKRMEIVWETAFATARSSEPSPLKSPTVAANGALPTPGVELCVNVPFPLFKSMETELE